MAFITYPLNNIDYTAEDAELFHCTRTSGIWAEDSFSISVTGADNNVTVGTGIAWINNEEFSGKVTALKSAEVLDLGIADSTYPRIDVIAIQFNANNNATDVIIKKGTPATNPVRPTIARTGAVYELYLASVYRPAGATAITAGNITDLRMDETVCGLMADSVTKVDMTTIEAQIRELINNLQGEIDGIKDLSGLMFETEWTEDGVIPISKGGTGADNVEDTQKNLQLDENYVILGLKAGVDLSTTESKVAFNKTIRNKGTLLSVSSNGVKIGAGISRVKVSANICLNPNTSTTAAEMIRIYKNDEKLYYSPTINVNGASTHSCISEYEIEVSEGDVIYLYGLTSVSGVGRVLNNSQFKVEVVR